MPFAIDFTPGVTYRETRSAPVIVIAAVDSSPLYVAVIITGCPAGVFCIAVTRPDESTVAMLVFDDDHVTLGVMSFCVLSENTATACSCVVVPFAILILPGDTAILSRLFSRFLKSVPEHAVNENAKSSINAPINLKAGLMRLLYVLFFVFIFFSYLGDVEGKTNAHIYIHEVSAYLFKRKEI